MMRRLFIVANLVCLVFLSACAHQPLKAPCNPSHCQGRIKVNTWN